MMSALRSRPRNESTSNQSCLVEHDNQVVIRCAIVALSVKLGKLMSSPNLATAWTTPDCLNRRSIYRG
eukprot:scaffold19502_cov68-Phaeocystis_antarctica.AAC.4